MEGLGRLFNVIPVGASVYVDMRLCAACTFICYASGGDTFTLSEAQNAGGTGDTNLATVTRYYTSLGTGGAWVKQTQAAAAAVTISGTGPLDAAVFTVDSAELSDGFTHIMVVPSASGTVVPILHDLYVQRAPANLPALV